MTEGFDITQIEETIGDIIYGLGVSANVFSNRPRSSQLDLKDFVVAAVKGAVTDRGAYGETVISVSLFVKDVANMKNGKRLSVMEQKLRNGIPYEVGKILFKPYSYRVLGDTDDGNGYSVRIVTINAFLKK